MKKQSPKKEFIFAPNQNMFYEDNNNTIFIEINEIDSCYIDKTNFCIQITADNGLGLKAVAYQQILLDITFSGNCFLAFVISCKIKFSDGMDFSKR